MPRAGKDLRNPVQPLPFQPRLIQMGKRGHPENRGEVGVLEGVAASELMPPKTVSEMVPFLTFIHRS